jgi:opacity protein-like surface antigen
MASCVAEFFSRRNNEMKSLNALLIAGLLVASTHAYAAVKQGGQQVGGALGFASPLSNETVDGETERFGQLGPAIGFNYLYQIRNNLSLGGDFNYKSLGHVDGSTRHGPVEVTHSAWTLLAIGRGDLMPENDLRPYGLVGLGIGGVSRKVDFSQRPDLNSSQTSNGLAFALGAGVDYDINPAWLAGAELRYNIIGTDENAVGTGHVSTLDVLLKVGYKF